MRFAPNSLVRQRQHKHGIKQLRASSGSRRCRTVIATRCHAATIKLNTATGIDKHNIIFSASEYPSWNFGMRSPTLFGNNNAKESAMKASTGVSNTEYTSNHSFVRRNVS